ncbi:unnamed protein product [Timema podura]|uniref:Uncharacterized protein n=1 Tax=Timema podura TaxID=61482 RepID=A0ABN7NQM1_TIMPD|nr:unnamed protein product [Timema podura]
MEEADEWEKIKALIIKRSEETLETRWIGGSKKMHSLELLLIKVPSTPIKKVTLPKKEKRSNEQVEEALKFMRSLRESINCKDEFIVYGENVASRMRAAGRSYRAVSIARTHIDNIIFNLKMGFYNERFTSPLPSFHGASQSSRNSFLGENHPADALSRFPNNAQGQPEQELPRRSESFLVLPAQLDGHLDLEEQLQYKTVPFSQILKRAVKSRLSSSADSLVEAEPCAKREERFLEHQEQIALIRLKQEQIILERERTHWDNLLNWLKWFPGRILSPPPHSSQSCLYLLSVTPDTSTYCTSFGKANTSVPKHSHVALSSSNYREQKIPISHDAMKS